MIRDLAFTLGGVGGPGQRAHTVRGGRWLLLSEPIKSRGLAVCLPCAAPFLGDLCRTLDKPAAPVAGGLESHGPANR